MDQLPDLTTAHLADACLRANIPVRCAPVRPITPGTRLSGRALPARHSGSVDIFLEALETTATPGDVLVVDNAARTDEACIGDLIALEAQSADLAGILIWGLHRDTADIQATGLPVFSLGALPTGPQRLDPTPPDALQTATIANWPITRSDYVLADDDGAIFLPVSALETLAPLAITIREIERIQANHIRAGIPLRTQLAFPTYLANRPRTTFREHLRTLNAAIEE
jgi:4-hydroxy-4-methyl-2-oxoglutarate aldolase